MTRKQIKNFLHNEGLTLRWLWIRIGKPMTYSWFAGVMNAYIDSERARAVIERSFFAITDYKERMK